jgi:DNA (cytosine-5)-methyltransferase 1
MGKKYNAIDLFAGIGGIRLGFEEVFDGDIKFVYSNDIDKYCAITYKANFNDELDTRDINEVIKNMEQIPNHDILLGGFPCQPFSMAGQKLGFKDQTRGTLFFSISEILDKKQPDAFLLENVAHFQKHNKGNTWKVVKEVLEKELNYKVFAKELDASDFGLPQKRKRFYMVGFKDKKIEFSFPEPEKNKPVLEQFLEKNVNEQYYLSQEYLNGLKRHREKHESLGHGFGYIVLDPTKDIANTLVVGGMGRERNLIRDKVLQNCWEKGDPLTKRNCEGIRKLTPIEFRNLQGFPSSFKIPVSNTQAYKQFGNSVPVAVIKAIAIKMKFALEKNIEPNKISYYTKD